MAKVSSPIAVPKHRSPWAVPLSVLAHAGLVAALVLSVAWKSEPPPALQAEIWEAIPSSPAPTPTPVPVATPEPEPVKPVAEKAPEPEAIAPKVIKKIEKKIEPKPAREPEPEPPKKAPKPTPKAEPKVDTTARDAARTREIARMNQLSQTAGLGGAPVLGIPQAGSAQGLGQGWGAKLKACVQPNLRYNDSDGENPRVVFVVKLSPTGAPSEPVVSKASGNSAFDAAVSRALLRCDPFPKPESGGYPSSVTVAYRLKD